MHGLGKLSVYLSLLIAAGAAAGAGATPAPGQSSRIPARLLIVTVEGLPLQQSSGQGSKTERAQLVRDMLDVLARYRIQAVGFINGEDLQAPGNESLLKLWLAAGHEPGNPGFGKTDYPAGDEERLANLERSRAALAGWLASRGGAVRFCRFPFGGCFEPSMPAGTLLEKLTAAGQQILPVTIPLDDRCQDTGWQKARQQNDKPALADLNARYLAAARHAVHQAEEHTAALLPGLQVQILRLHATASGVARWSMLFDWLREAGYGFISASEALEKGLLPPATQMPWPGWNLPAELRSMQEAARVRETVRQLLLTQAVSWNAGDLPAFCSVYSSDALFITAKGLSRGRQTILERYQKSYPDRAAMGRLSFEFVEIRPFGSAWLTELGLPVPGPVQGCTVAARWILEYPGQPAKSGHTLIVLQPAGGGWVIVQDASL